LDASRRQGIECRSDIARGPHLRRHDFDLQLLSRRLDLSPLWMSLWIVYIVHQSDPLRSGNNLARKFKLLCWEALHVRGYSRHIRDRPSLARDKAKPNRISEHWNDDWNRIGGFFGGNGLKGCRGDNDIGIELNQLLRRLGELLHAEIGRSVYYFEIPAFDVPEFSHPLQE